MARAVGFWVVDLEAVVGVLHRRHAKPAPRELLDEAHGERRLAGLLPAGDADDRGLVIASWLRHGGLTDTGIVPSRLQQRVGFVQLIRHVGAERGGSVLRPLLASAERRR